MSRRADVREAGPDGRDTRWSDHRSARRERILVTAIEMIDVTGGDVGVAAIAARAQIPRSVVYKLFKDRRDLDEQIRERIVAELTTHLAPSLELRGSLRDIVGRTIRSYVAWVDDHRRLHRFLGAGSSAHPAHDSRALVGGKATVGRMLQSLIESAVPVLIAPKELPRGAAEDLSYGVLGMTDNVVNRWLAAGRGRSSAKQLTRFLVEAACGQIQAAAALVDTSVDLDREF